ncbi:MAG: PadR family transcriptional regulator [Candidatus Nomurabacteria bacterium]|jgi:PadR family transcriptional regulator PadR|nr:PadR family transcriptional regulator [Candidatus Nomurabacteria bacterium]
MQNKDNNMDNIVDRSEGVYFRAEFYAGQLTTQLKKGLLSYCVLLACEELTYTSEVINRLNLAELHVAEGTVYPLLARLQKDGLLEHRWRESYQGPPRKYYVVTDYGRAVRKVMAGNVRVLNSAIKTLERSKW